MVSADGKSELTVARVYSKPSATRKCEICGETPVTRLVDLHVVGKLLECYLLCPNNDCLNSLAEQTLGIR